MLHLSHYDYIIGGAGCAGLDFALQLFESGIDSKKVLIIDKQHRESLNYSLSFWTNEKSHWDEVVRKKWNKIQVISENGEVFEDDLQAYTYNFLEGKQMYDYVKDKLSVNSNFHFKSDYINRTIEINQKVWVFCEGSTFTCDYFFDSTNVNIIKDGFIGNKAVYQQFVGFFIETKEDFFNDEVATLMDFRPQQHDYLRFVYTMPFSKTTALIEFTMFTPSLKSFAEVENELQNYLRTQINISGFKITETERGIIEMNRKCQYTVKSSRIIPIGRCANMLKPTTGYAFRKIQNDSKYIVNNIVKRGIPKVRRLCKLRFKIYDSIMLKVLTTNSNLSRIYFEFFKNNNAVNFLRFLDEETNLEKEIKVIKSVKDKSFVRASKIVLLGILKLKLS